VTAGGELAPVVAVVVARDGRLPAGAAETAAEAGGRALVVGSGAEEAAAMLVDAGPGSGPVGWAWWAATGTEPGALARRLAPVLEPVSLVLLPASPDGRDLAPRLAATLDRPLLAGAVEVELAAGRVRADLLRVDGRVVVPVDGPAPAVATLMPGVRSPGLAGPVALPAAAAIGLPGWAGAEAGAGAGTELLALIKPDPATMDLADAGRVLGGGAGLVARGAGDDEARALFALLARVAAALGASAGATRVVTDAGWIGAERQIGTTGVSIDPDLYVAFGVSGATQHTSGLGTPRHIVSINTDPSCPMTAMANLGLICDASQVLSRLAQRLGVVATPTPDRPARSGGLGG
jgi:electron transfer flavoprotein alpha subunit